MYIYICIHIYMCVCVCVCACVYVCVELPLIPSALAGRQKRALSHAREHRAAARCAAFRIAFSQLAHFSYLLLFNSRVSPSAPTFNFCASIRIDG